MGIYEASVSLMVRAMVVSARWAARSRGLSLERACAGAEAGRVAHLEARLLLLEDALAFRDTRPEALEQAFLCHGPPKHLITDQEGVFVGEAFTALLRDWGTHRRLGAVGKHGSIAVTERLIWTLKREWLARAPLICGLDHLGELPGGCERYYNHHRGHRRLGGATRSIIYQGGAWQKPDRSAKTPQHPIRLRYFPEPRGTVYELAA